MVELKEKKKQTARTFTFLLCSLLGLIYKALLFFSPRLLAKLSDKIFSFTILKKTNLHVFQGKKVDQPGHLAYIPTQFARNRPTKRKTKSAQALHYFDMLVDDCCISVHLLDLKIVESVR